MEKRTSEVILAKLDSIDANGDVWTKEGLESLIEVAKGAGFDAFYDSHGSFLSFGGILEDFTGVGHH